jgi:hypothetical protein
LEVWKPWEIYKLTAFTFTLKRHMRKLTILLLLSGFWGTTHAQKGEIQFAAGPLMSFPLGLEGFGTNIKIAPGAEIIGQYNFTNRSAFLLKATLHSWRYKEPVPSYGAKRYSILALQGGYRYQFGTSGFFIDGLVGVDIELNESFNSGAFTLGFGKRFIKEKRFIDVGMDIVGADAEERINIKVLFSIF